MSEILNIIWNWLILQFFWCYWWIVLYYEILFDIAFLYMYMWHFTDCIMYFIIANDLLCYSWQFITLWHLIPVLAIMFSSNKCIIFPPRGCVLFDCVSYLIEYYSVLLILFCISDYLFYSCPLKANCLPLTLLTCPLPSLSFTST